MDWQLGDERLDCRAEFCIRAIQDNCDKSFPDIFPEARDQVGFYRFISNERYTFEDLMAALENDAYCKAVDSEVLAIHDTTKVVMGNKINSIDEFKVKKGRRIPGFFAHLTLLVRNVPDIKEVLGPGCLTVWSRGTKFKEAERWFNNVNHVESNRLPQKTIHVMDREGDSFNNIHSLQNAGYRFVVRLAHDRLIDDDSQRKLFSLMDSKEIICEREVKLSKRVQSKFPTQARIHPSRESRISTLEITAAPVIFKRGGRTPKNLPNTMAVNILKVKEKNPPKNQKPIVWHLVTSEPIDTTEQIEKVIDIYRRRWIIEEFFKALKTGCRLEERLFESAQTWYKILVLLLPAAVNLLNLRTLDNEPLKNSKIFNLKEKKVLSQQAKRFKLSLLTLADAKLVIAKLGGYTQSPWPPGWIILGRGYEKIQLMASTI